MNRPPLQFKENVVDTVPFTGRCDLRCEYYILDSIVNIVQINDVPGKFQQKTEFKCSFV